jgi:DNA polymerase elongation subunit (family B)
MVVEGYRLKTKPKIVMVSTPYRPGGLFQQIELDQDSPYHKLFLHYSIGVGKIYNPEEIEKERQQFYFKNKSNQEDLVISKLLGQDIEKYKSLFPHVSAAIQLTNKAGGKQPTKGDTIQYIYTNSQHKNPLCRVVPLEILQKVEEKEKDGKEENGKTLNYDKDKYREMILDAADTVLGYFGFNRAVYENPRNNRKKKKWYDELQEERTKDIQTEIL